MRLESGPQHVRVELGPRWRLTVSGTSATWTRRGRRGEKTRELPLRGSRLWVARAHPTRDVALWYEVEPGVVERLGGVRPVDFFAHPDSFAAWRSLDRLATELGEALAPWSGGATEAIELGRGEHRVLVVALADRLVIHARPFLRERPRRALEVARDGTLLVAGKGGDRRARFRSRLAVHAVHGRIDFAGEDDQVVASLRLPGMAPEDRAELARRCGELVDPPPPEPQGAPHREPLRPWASGLGRPRAVASFVTAPARFRR